MYSINLQILLGPDRKEGSLFSVNVMLALIGVTLCPVVKRDTKLHGISVNTIHLVCGNTMCVSTSKVDCALLRTCLALYILQLQCRFF